MLVTWLMVAVTALTLLMAVRAFQSGTILDRVLGGFLLVGLVLLFMAPDSIAVCWLAMGASFYLISQIITSARMLSRALPLLNAFFLAALYFV